MKIQQAAQKANLPIDTYCNNISKEYESMFKNFNVDYSSFVRTTDKNHKLAVEKFWVRNYFLIDIKFLLTEFWLQTLLNDKGYIFPTNYSGWYCIPDETFLTESQLTEVPGKNIKVSIESGHPVEWTEEKNYMFKLSSFHDDLNYWLKNGRN